MRAALRPRRRARPFRLLGQYKGTLMLLEGPDGLYLIDQHVAHERILYERLRRSLAAEARRVQHAADARPLLELAPAERLRLLELAREPASVGFELDGPVRRHAGPDRGAGRPLGRRGRALLRRLAADDDGRRRRPSDLRRRVLEALAASLACKAAVKMHHPLCAPRRWRPWSAELFAAEQPYACPHGRPIVLQMTDADLERRFGRRG